MTAQRLYQWFSTFVRPQLGKFLFYKTRDSPNQCQGLVQGHYLAVEKHWPTGLNIPKTMKYVDRNKCENWEHTSQSLLVIFSVTATVSVLCEIPKPMDKNKKSLEDANMIKESLVVAVDSLFNVYVNKSVIKKVPSS
jgi:hypothetical protein